MAEARGCGAGGIAGLHRLLTEHGGAVESDLSRYHGLHLADLFTGHLTVRRLLVLIKHLPEDSALGRAMGRWTVPEYLLSHVWQAAARSKKPHPATPKAQTYRSPKRERALQRARARARERARAIAAGEIT